MLLGRASKNYLLKRGSKMPIMYRCLLCDETNLRPEAACQREDCGYKTAKWRDIEVSSEVYENARKLENYIAIAFLVIAGLVILFFLGISVFK
jgi:hypothetical protein